MDPALSTPYFELEGVRQSFAGREVLRGVSLSIPRGQTTVILGGSGTGKSVLLKHLNGLMRPVTGEVRVNGVALGSLPERGLRPIRRKIGMLFQDGALFDSMTVGGNIAFALRESGERDEALIARRIEELLALVGLSGEVDKLPGTISGGMKKRAALARALATGPDSLLVDEPTAGLDPILAKHITLLIRRLSCQLHLTCVMVTHHLESMRAVADQVIFLKEGQVRFAGKVSELETSDDHEIRAFLAADRIGLS